MIFEDFLGNKIGAPTWRLSVQLVPTKQNLWDPFGITVLFQGISNHEGNLRFASQCPGSFCMRKWSYTHLHILSVTKYFFSLKIYEKNAWVFTLFIANSWGFGKEEVSVWLEAQFLLFLDGVVLDSRWPVFWNRRSVMSRCFLTEGFSTKQLAIS